MLHAAGQQLMQWYTYSNTSLIHAEEVILSHSAPVAGEHESRALQMEIMKASRIRPRTHDVAKNIVGALGHGITRVVITDIVQNT